MATDEQLPVDEESLIAIMVKLRDIRAWATATRADPWAFRQAMITIMAIDTAVARQGGVTAFDLNAFDMAARARAKEIIDSLPKEARARGR